MKGKSKDSGLRTQGSGLGIWQIANGDCQNPNTIALHLPFLRPFLLFFA